MHEHIRIIMVQGADTTTTTDINIKPIANRGNNHLILPEVRQNDRHQANF